MIKVIQKSSALQPRPRAGIPQTLHLVRKFALEATFSAGSDLAF